MKEEQNVVPLLSTQQTAEDRKGCGERTAACRPTGGDTSKDERGRDPIFTRVIRTRPWFFFLISTYKNIRSAEPRISSFVYVPSWSGFTFYTRYRVLIGRKGKRISIYIDR
jgi:hypothetical protein